MLESLHDGQCCYLYYVLAATTIPVVKNKYVLSYQILAEAQSVMLWCATPAAVWEQDMGTFNKYFREQHHDSLADYLHFMMVDQQHHNIHAQVNIYTVKP